DHSDHRAGTRRQAEVQSLIQPAHNPTLATARPNRKRPTHHSAIVHLVLLAPLAAAIALENPAVVVGLAFAEGARAVRTALLDHGGDGGVPARPVGDEPGVKGRPGGRGVAGAGTAPDRFLGHGGSLARKFQ